MGRLTYKPYFRRVILQRDRKSTRLNSSHSQISYAVFCLKKKNTHVVIYSKNPDADRAFSRDTLNYQCVDAVHGWRVYALPPAEFAIHAVCARRCVCGWWV